MVARYLGANPNGSLRDIAGITNERGNVVGLMPHPEHAVEDRFGPGTDGLGFFGLLERARRLNAVGAGCHPGQVVTVDDVRRLCLSLPRTTEHLVRDRVKFRAAKASSSTSRSRATRP